jgi:hypothetical protein
VRDLYAIKKIDWQVFERTMMPSPSKVGFLELNYQNPEVRKYIESLKQLIPAHDPLKSFPEDILSGKGKDNIEYESRENDRPLSIDHLMLSSSYQKAVAPSQPTSLVSTKTPNSSNAPMFASQFADSTKTISHPFVLPVAIGLLALIGAGVALFLRLRK